MTETLRRRIMKNECLELALRELSDFHFTPLKLGDDSAAIASCFITLITRQSFYGREDPRLFEDKLLPELLGIFHWALEGLKRLRERGHFIETEASEDARNRLSNLGSLTRAFIAEQCELGPDQQVLKDVLFDAWRDYNKANA